MNYNIEIKLPKKNIRQYALEDKYVSDLSAQEFKDLITNYQNHIALSKGLSNLKINNQKIIWNPTNEQLNFLTQYYSQNPIGFADTTTNPGNNNTFNIEQGIIYLAQIPAINGINNSYIRIGIQPIPFIRLQGQNVKLPTENINQLYVQEKVNPDAETFENILRDLIKNNKLSAPITYNQYKALTPKFYIYNNVLYNLPNHKELDNKNSPYYISFYKVKNEYFGEEIIIKRFEDNYDAWKQFLLDNQDINAYSFNDRRNKYPLYPSPKTGQPIHYYTYENLNYFIPSFNELTDTLSSYYHDIIVNKRPSTNSIGNKVLEKIRNESTIQDLLPSGFLYKTEFKCSDDPRYNNFIEQMIDKGRGKNIFLYLMSSIKDRKTIKKTESGKNLHCINLSTNIYENIPYVKDGWREKFESGEIHEFELICHRADSKENTCVEWKCTTYTPTSNGGINVKSSILSRANFLPARYTFDAVITDQDNNVKFVLEFDGSDHYIARKGNTVANKLVSDQVKENFCAKNGIKSIRIPYFSKHKSANFEKDFEAFVMNIVKKYLGIETEQNYNANPAIKEFNLSRK